MNEEAQKFFDKMKTMNEDDLRGYLSAGKFISRTCTVIGVGSLLTMMLVPTLLVIGPGLCIVYFLSQVASAASTTAAEAKKHLVKYD